MVCEQRPAREVDVGENDEGKRMEMVPESVSNDKKCTLEGTEQGESEDLKEIYCS